jgi:hypothetical protein
MTPLSLAETVRSVEPLCDEQSLKAEECRTAQEADSVIT